MIGAMRTIWPFWTYDYYLLPLKPEKGPILETATPFLPDLSTGLFWISCGFALAGFSWVFAVEYLAQYKQKQEINKQRNGASVHAQGR